MGCPADRNATHIAPLFLLWSGNGAHRPVSRGRGDDPGLEVLSVRLHPASRPRHPEGVIPATPL